MTALISGEAVTSSTSSSGQRDDSCNDKDINQESNKKTKTTLYFVHVISKV